MNNKRWYDFDSTISLAVNLLSQADEMVKKHCLNYIIKQARESGIELEDNIAKKYDFVWQRRTDSSSHFFEAMEYLKKADFEFQKDISLNVIRYIQELEKNAKDDN